MLKLLQRLTPARRADVWHNLVVRTLESEASSAAKVKKEIEKDDASILSEAKESDIETLSVSHSDQREPQHEEASQRNRRIGVKSLYSEESKPIPEVQPDFHILPDSFKGERPESKIEPDRALVDVLSQQEQMWKLAQPFDDVPGPISLRLLGQLYSVLPKALTQLTASIVYYGMSMVGSNLLWSRGVNMFNRIFDTYGPVVRLRSPMGGDIVLLIRPEHIEQVYRQEGRFPIRSALDSLEKYRLQKCQLRSAGPFIMSGPEWDTVRSKIEIPIQRSAEYYSEKLESVSEKFVQRIRQIRNRQEEVPEDFHNEIFKWSLENLALVALDRNLGLLDFPILPENSESFQLLSALMKASQGIRSCETGLQLWRFFETPVWRNMARNCEIIDRIVEKQVQYAQKHMFEKGLQMGDAPLLETLLLSGDMPSQDVHTVLLDMLILGVNLTSHSMAFLLYHLAKNPRCQKKVFDEVLTILPEKNTKLTFNNLRKLSYLQACLKESLRLKPPIPVLSRVIQHDIVLHGYKIPKGTYILMPTHVAALREENFEDALRFKPDRWFPPGENYHPFAVLPFGHGPRSCAGRGLAELMLWLLSAKIVRNFSIEYHYGEMQTSKRMLAMPDKRLNFRFVDRFD